MPTIGSYVGEVVGYFQVFCNHLNQVISSLRDELYSQEASQRCFLAMKVASMMARNQCFLGFLLNCYSQNNQDEIDALD